MRGNLGQCRLTGSEQQTSYKFFHMPNNMKLISNRIVKNIEYEIFTRSPRCHYFESDMFYKKILLSLDKTLFFRLKRTPIFFYNF